MSVTIPAEFDSIIEEAIYVWFTSIRIDDTPHTTPIWFIRDGETFYFYTQPGSVKVKNLQANPNVSISFAKDHEGEDFFVIDGTAQIESSLPTPHLNAVYMAKYANAPYMVQTTPEKYSTIFSLPIRITPRRLRRNA